MQIDKYELIGKFYGLPDYALVDTKMASVVVGVSESTLRHERVDKKAKNIVPFVRIGKKVLYRKSNIIEWLNNLTSKGLGVSHETKPKSVSKKKQASSRK